jgi:periplasmic protein TonB
MNLKMTKQALLLTLSVLAIACAAPARDSSSSNDIVAPVVLYKTEPHYPDSLRKQGITGMVRIEGTIDTTGQLRDPRVIVGQEPALNDLALAAVRNWRFKPATLNGQPVEVIFQVDVQFPR